MPIEYGAEHVEKRLSSRERREPEAILRLRSEATLLERLSTLRVTPRLLARGEDDGGPWHRLERIALPTLADRLVDAPLGAPWIERAIRSGLEVLARLHEAADDRGPMQVVHADLSPANVAVAEDASRVVLLDLDLAWWRDGPVRDGAFRGTIGYVAPEIARGEPPTAQSDLFALAAALFHAATGGAPRSGASLPALLAEAAEVSVAPLAARLLYGRGRGHALLVECLAHEPSRRPASARAALASLG